MKIPVLHLKDGFHHFEFEIKGTSLAFESNKIYPENLKIEVDIDKFGKNIRCKLDIDTTAHYICDRCLESFTNPYHEHFELLYHIGTDDFETDEEGVFILPPETVEIDLTDRIIEYLILTIPMKNICRIECKGICPGCGADLNNEACQCVETVIDPRWEGLRKLMK